jgi:hypothetical protein
MSSLDQFCIDRNRPDRRDRGPPGGKLFRETQNGFGRRERGLEIPIAEFRNLDRLFRVPLLKEIHNADAGRARGLLGGDRQRGLAALSRSDELEHPILRHHTTNYIQNLPKAKQKFSNWQAG